MIISMEGNQLQVGTEPNKRSTLTGIRTVPSAGRTVCSLSGIHTAPSAGRTVCIGFEGIHTAPWAGRIGRNRMMALKNERMPPLAHRTLGTVKRVIAVAKRLALVANWHK